ncbi:glycosyltransferase family 2 protein [Alteribacter aurantiacus]|uniref:glycosyltransferase family 2 protein n=1 Tax=Alteribacter aurantiacus TaxID=254410 RepID=UPI000415FBEA|nr:glycosyltransferase family 2 protein [Alteribacter aurantiacus]
MINKPFISICMPLYNEINKIDSSIQSILNQNYSNFELLISDNHSTDGTYERVKSYHDPRITLFRKDKNVGWRKNSNYLLKKVKGKYIFTLHGDDRYIDYAFLYKIVNLFETNPKVGVIHIIPPKAFTIVFKKKTLMSANEYYSFIGSLRYMPPPSLTIYRRDAIKGTGFYLPDDWTGEACLSMKIANKGYNAMFLSNQYIERGTGLDADRLERLRPENLWERYIQRANFFRENRMNNRITTKDKMHLVTWLKNHKP